MVSRLYLLIIMRGRTKWRLVVRNRASAPQSVPSAHARIARNMYGWHGPCVSLPKRQEEDTAAGSLGSRKRQVANNDQNSTGSAGRAHLRGSALKVSDARSCR